jgi:hypothetical protein
MGIKILMRSHWGVLEGSKAVSPDHSECRLREGLKLPALRRKHAGLVDPTMTINAMLATSDGLVVGVDSIASTTHYFIDPMDMEWIKNDEGDFAEDEEGRLTLKFRYEDFQSVVTNAWGGVTKLFEIHPHPSPVVAATAGTAKLRDRPIASIARDFYNSHQRRNKKLVTMQTICGAFQRFMRERYDEHYKNSRLPPNLRDGPTLLLGGYGREDAFPSIYRLKVKENVLSAEFTGGKSGISWNGQSDAVERFIRGYDSDARSDLRQELRRALSEHSDTLTRHFTGLINEILDKVNAQIPDGIDLSVPKIPTVTVDWNKYKIPIDYANLPIQDAIDFVSFLVMMQAGRSRFAFGVPTVGGRTHIGVVTKDKGFQLLSEPELSVRLRIV